MVVCVFHVSYLVRLVVYADLFLAVGWLCFTSHRQRGHLETAPHLLSIVKDVKLGNYTFPTGNQTPGRRVAVHYATAAPRKLFLAFLYL